MLLTCRSDTTLAESLWLVAAGFGSGLQVWERADFATGDGEYPLVMSDIAIENGHL